MSGSVFFMKDRMQWAVGFRWQGKKYNITRYKGQLMKQVHPNKRKDNGYINANRLLAQMQGDVENGVFRIEKYTGKIRTDILPFFEEWLEHKATKKPATIKGYKSYYKNWIKPFFEDKAIQLHEVQLDTLHALLRSIDLQPKGKHNVMMCFHAFMDYAWRSRRVLELPPFPKKEEYGLTQPVIKWLPEERQMNIIEAIPQEHRLIFLFLKYTMRRPAEACSLYKEDFCPFQEAFTIRRSISARTLVESTKTGAVHLIPCPSPILSDIKKAATENPESPFLFINPRARLKGKAYTGESLNRLWKHACKKAGETIDLYSGLKHSSCSQFINEKGVSVSDLQLITDHARLESVKRYAKVELARKRELMESSVKTPATKLRKVK